MNGPTHGWLIVHRHAAHASCDVLHANDTGLLCRHTNHHAGVLHWDACHHWYTACKHVLCNYQGSHRNLIIKFHDFSMTIYAVFPDARKGNRIICMYSSHIHPVRKESQIYFKTENKESERWFVSCLNMTSTL